jgi:rhodanese-related sulfurtransferase
MQEQYQQPCLAATELKSLLHSTPGNVTIIDVRNPDEFAVLHIPDAINIPLVELNSRIQEITPKEKIVTVCTKGAGRSAEAALFLDLKGFKGATYLCGGTLGWYEVN